MIRPIAKPTPRLVEKMLAKRQRERDAIENRAKVRKRDGGRCVACGKVGYTDAHHIKFRSQGGSDDVSNQVSVCRDCHKAIHGHALKVHGHDASSVRQFRAHARRRWRSPVRVVIFATRGGCMLLKDGIRSHPKILQAGAEAAWLWAAAIDYSRDHLTDGFVPAAALVTLGVFRTPPQKLAEVLVRERLLDVVDGGYHVHDYLEENDPAEKVKAKRKRDKDRKADERAKAETRRESSGVRPSRVHDLSDGIPCGQKDARAIARERVGVGVGTGSGSDLGLDLREEREKGAAGGMPGDDVWTAWREAGARHGVDRIEANPSGANWPKHLATIRGIVRGRAELESALDCWWASPFVTAGRNVGLFASALPEVLAHLAAGHAHAFRDPRPPAAGSAPRRFCEHEPECTSWKEHRHREIDDMRAAEGLAPRAMVAS